LSGVFSAITGSVPTPGLAQSVVVGADSVDLVLSSAAPPNATAFAAGTSAAILGGQRANALLLDRWGADLAESAADFAAASSAPPRVRASPPRPGSADIAEALGTALPGAMPQYGGWFRGIGSLASVGGNAVAPGFTANQGGFLAGLDRPVGEGIWLGGAAGYAHTDVAESSASQGDIDTARVALYGGTRFGPAVLTGTTGYAYDRISTARLLAGPGTAREVHDGHEVTAAVQAALPLNLTAVTVTPKAGLQFLHLHETAFTESGADGFDVSNGGGDTDSLQPYIAISAAKTFITDEGATITPQLRLGYSREALSNTRSLTVTVGGAAFAVQGVKPSKDMLNAGIGLTLRAQDNVNLYASYDAVVPIGNTTVQTVSAGLRIRF
jgi:fibronectin-binding autotransporter adhesin